MGEIAWTNRQLWRPVPIGGLIFSFAFIAFIAWRVSFAGGWVPLVDDANFAVHEAGHPLAAVFSARFAVYGGTFAQLLFPLICMFEFWRRRWTVSYALCGIWLGQSLLNVARYVADARTMELPLKGFTDHPMHDWNVILLRWGLLTHDTAIASVLRAIAWLGIGWALVFLVGRWRAAETVAVEC
ncbi:MAG: hypothetical protein ABI547_01845 [Betaproteobacteria bacterium]